MYLHLYVLYRIELFCTYLQIYSIPHPSPRATNNTDWQNKTIKHMESLNLLQYFSK